MVELFEKIHKKESYFILSYLIFVFLSFDHDDLFAND